MYYKIIKNKIKFYDIKVDKKINRIINKIIKKHGIKEHKNVVSSAVFNPIERDSIIVNYTYKYLFFGLLCEFDYDIIYYPSIIKELNAIIETKDYRNLSFLNKYQVPRSIKNMNDGRCKNNIIKHDYPYAVYIKEIKDCFKASLVKEIEFTDEVDMINKILKAYPNNRKIRQEDIQEVLIKNELSFIQNDELNCYL